MADTLLSRAAAPLLAALIAGALTGAAAAEDAKPADNAKQTETAQAADPAADAQKGPVKATTTDYDASTVIATVNGHDITLGQMILAHAGLPAQYQQLPPEMLYEGLLQQLTDQALLADLAEKDGLDDNPAARAQLANSRAEVLSQSYLRDYLAKAVTEDKLKEAYQKQYVDAEPVQEVRASHILVDSEDKAKEIKAKLDDGADFAELAKEYGTDGTKDKGGDLGYFDRSQMVKPFADAAFALDKGEISDPIQTQFGWHVIKVTDMREKPVPEFDKVKQKLTQDVSRKLAEAEMTRLRESADIAYPEVAPAPEAIGRQDLLSAK